jgi:hypothetical protein
MRTEAKLTANGAKPVVNPYAGRTRALGNQFVAEGFYPHEGVCFQAQEIKTALAVMLGPALVYFGGAVLASTFVTH